MSDEIKEFCEMLDCPPSANFLRAAIERLIKENQDLHDILEGNARDALIKEMHFQDGAMEMYIEHPIFGMFAAAIADYFIKSEVKNYTETRLWCDKVGYVVVTCQKETGQSPHQLRQAAEAERDAARAELEDVRAVLEKYRFSDSPVNPAALASMIIQILITDAREMAEVIRYARRVGLLTGRRTRPKVKALLAKHDAMFAAMHIDTEAKP